MFRIKNPLQQLSVVYLEIPLCSTGTTFRNVQKSTILKEVDINNAEVRIMLIYSKKIMLNVSMFTICSVNYYYNAG